MEGGEEVNDSGWMRGTHMGMGACEGRWTNACARILRNPSPSVCRNAHTHTHTHKHTHIHIHTHALSVSLLLLACIGERSHKNSIQDRAFAGHGRSSHLPSDRLPASLSPNGFNTPPNTDSLHAHLSCVITVSLQQRPSNARNPSCTSPLCVTRAYTDTLSDAHAGASHAAPGRSVRNMHNSRNMQQHPDCTALG